MAYAFNSALDAAANYNAWVAAGRPNTDMYGNTLDVRGEPMASNAWAGVDAGLTAQAQPGYKPGATPGYTLPTITPTPLSTTPGATMPTAGALPASNIPGPLNTIPGQLGGPAPAPGRTTLPQIMGQAPPVGTLPGNSGGGQLGSAGYPLDVNKYMDPSVAFRLQLGKDAISNAAAATGNYKSGTTLKDLMTFGQNLASTEYGNAFNRATGQQQFAYNADVGDRDFGYRAATGDRDYNTNLATTMAQLGLGGASGQAGTTTSLAQAIAANLATQGAIQGNTTLGGSTAINNAISQLLASLGQSSTLSQIMARIPQTQP